MDFPSSVAPFILRGVSLLGIDSVMAPRELRQPAWDRLARDLDAASLDRISSVIGLSEVPNAAQNIVSGNIRGRVVVDVNR
jgi:acrylyl-CoA reductase (NADPH)